MLRLLTLTAVILLTGCSSLKTQSPDRLFLSCRSDNDLHRVLVDNGVVCTRLDRPDEAIAQAPDYGAVLILADGYPDQRQVLANDLFEKATAKHLRLYIEYPSSLPEMKLGDARRTRWERAVISSEAFGPRLAKLRILQIHDCRFIPVEAARPHIVMARVAGFDTAVYGLPSETWPVLFEHPRGDMLVATTKLSQFVTARYTPADAWPVVWKMILQWLRHGRDTPELKWTPAVRPTHGPLGNLPKEAAALAVRRGTDWYRSSRLLLHPDAMQGFNEAAGYDDRVGPGPAQRGWPAGDGRLGMLEGPSSRITFEGRQHIRWYVRSDCTSESAMALALRSLLDGDQRSKTTAVNLQDFVHFTSNLRQGPRADVQSPSYGLIGWNTIDTGVYYGDDNARSTLGTMATAAALHDDRWDASIVRTILANFRTTGPEGFRNGRLEEADLQARGWKHYWTQSRIHFAPHYESWIWACYLWLYDKTKHEPLLDRSKTGIRLMMQAYPHQWRWTNGIQQERARMLLPLAWLIRVDDTPEHRAWLRRMIDDMLAHQDKTGAIREQLGELGQGRYRPPQSNEEYGTEEASLIQSNGDPVADMTYTCHVAFIGLLEAAAATGDEKLVTAADRLAEFLIRIQVRSESHPELDGVWFRAFDFQRWEYWGSDADLGWGVCSADTGWGQAWIASVLAMRDLHTNLWTLTAGSKVADQFDRLRQAMLP